MRRSFGQVSELRSGRYQARWKVDGVYYTARRSSDGGPLTFSTEKKAEDYLTKVRLDIEADRWTPPVKQTKVESQTFDEFAEEWLNTRRTRRGTPLKPSTRQLYRGLLDRVILPTLGDKALDEAADEDTFEAWYQSLDAEHLTQNAHAYSLARSILHTAHKRKLIDTVPPEIDGAGTTKRRRPIRPLSIDELARLVAAMPERYRLMVLLYAWCAVRFGELAALRKRDVDVKRRVIHVDRGVTRTQGEWHEDTPKSGEGGDVAIPPHIVKDIEVHIKNLRANDLLFPARQGGFMSGSTFHKVFRTAKTKIGRPDIRPHDLRHLGSMLAAAAGASPAELMQRLRHKTAQAAQIYWHAAKERDQEIAKLMSKMATTKTNVVPIGAAKKTKKKRKEGTA